MMKLLETRKLKKTNGRNRTKLLDSGKLRKTGNENLKNEENLNKLLQKKIGGVVDEEMEEILLEEEIKEIILEEVIEDKTFAQMIGIFEENKIGRK